MQGWRRSDRGSDRLRRALAALPTIVTFAVATVTLAGRLLGPPPQPGQVPADLTASPDLLVSEPSDRLVLVGWWLVAFLLLVLASRWIARDRPATSEERERRRPIVGPTIEMVALGILFLSITWTGDLTKFWSGITIVMLLMGAALSGLCAVILAGPRRSSQVLSILLGVAVAAVALTDLWQSRGFIIDTVHLPYTADELAAVAAGRLPLTDYVPMYSVLLGIPVAPLLWMLGSQAVHGLIGWVLVLQVVCLVMAVFVVFRVGGKRTIAPAALLMCAPVLAVGSTGTSAASYFQVFPLRIVLPMVLIVAAASLLGPRSGMSAPIPRMQAVGLGALAAVVVLNNPDFGLPALLAVLTALVLSTRSARVCISQVGWLALGAVLVPLGFMGIAAVRHSSVSWSDWLFFQRIFGLHGFMSVPMTPFGLHVAVVVLFTTTAVTGVLLLRRRSRHLGKGYRSGVLLTLVGVWSLLCLPYFAGRSLVPTLVGGYAFLVGLNTAALLVFVPASIRWRTSRLSASHAGQAGAFSARPYLALAFAATASCLLLVTPPWTRIAEIQRSDGPVRVVAAAAAIDSSITSLPPTSAVKRAREGGRLIQALTAASLVELETGIPAVGPSPHPWYYEFVPELTRRLCASPALTTNDLLLMEERTFAAVARVPECTAALDIADSIPVATQFGDIIAVPVNHRAGDS